MVELHAHEGRVELCCPAIPDNSVDLSIFSPPYFRVDGYTPQLMVSVGQTLARTLKPGARAYMVFGQIKEGLHRPLEAQRLVLAGGGGSLIPGQTIIWVKSIAVGGWIEAVDCPKCGEHIEHEVPVLSRGHFQPINSPHLLNYCWEYVFCFVRDPEKGSPPLDRLSIGVPFSDKSNLKRGNRGKNGDVHCIGDVWFIPYETTGPTAKKDHRHEFPDELARRLIKLSAIPKNSMVLDMFLGGGTTAKVAYEQGMNVCGYDMDPNAITRLKRWWADTVEASV